MRTIALLLLCILIIPIRLHAQTLPDNFGGSSIEELLDLVGVDIEDIFFENDNNSFFETTGEDVLNSTGSIIDRYATPIFISNPRHPGEREVVTVSLQDYGNPVTFSDIRWYVNGDLHSSGVGLRSITVETGNFGETLEIRAEVQYPGRLTHIPPITIRATRVDVLWEATDASAPPFYRGKALPSADSNIKIYALPHVYNNVGVKIPQSEFLFTWRKDSMAVGQSGYGRNSITDRITATRIIHPFSIEISSGAGNISARGSVSVRLNNPDMIVYEKHPLQGIIFEKALGSSLRVSQGATMHLFAQPLGIDRRLPSDVSFDWEFNGTPLIKTPQMANGEIALMTDVTSLGTSRVSIRATSARDQLRSVRKNLSITVE